MKYCDKCGKPATHHTWLNINGKKHEKHLCAQCARVEREQEEDFIEPCIGEFFDFPVAFARKKPSRRTIVCPTCGYTSQEFFNSGMLNCPDCYKYLCGVDEPSVEAIFGSKELNSISLKGDDFLPQASELDNLREQLRIAIKNERYEEAGQIKNQIQKLQKGDE